MKIVLLGDSIRMGYQPLVSDLLPEPTVWGPQENCRHSLWVLEHFEQWVARQEPDIVHMNFGIHDANPREDGVHQILLPQYALSLQRIIDRIRRLDGIRLIWATTTPLFEPQPDVPMQNWPRKVSARLDEYNHAALEIVHRENIQVNDLHGVITRHGHDTCMNADGVHMNEFGNTVLAQAVADSINACMNAMTPMSTK